MQQHFIAEISKVIYGVIPEILDLEIPEAIRTIFKIGEFWQKIIINIFIGSVFLLNIVLRQVM